MNRLSLRTILTISFTLVAFVPLAFFLVGAYNVTRGLLEQQVVDQANVETQKMTQNLDLSIAPIKEDVLLMSSLPGITDLLAASGTAPSAELVHELSAFSQTRKLYDHISIYDISGNERMRVNYDNNTPTLAASRSLETSVHAPYVSQALALSAGQIYTSNLELDAEGGVVETPYHPVIHYATPVYDDSGHIRGVLVIAVLMKDLLDAMRATANVSDGAGFYFVDQSGHYLINTVTPKEEWAWMTSGKGDFTTDFSSLATRILGTTDPGSFETADDVVAYSSYSPTPAQNGTHAAVRWTAIKITPKASAFAPLHSFTALFGGSVTLVIILIIILAYLLSRRVTVPVVSLARAAGKVSEGHLEQKIEIPVSGGGELRQLAEAFQKMLADLRHMTSLEEELKRARQLEHAKSEFISISAHQLRTPLSTIKWTLQMLQDEDFGALNPEQHKALSEGIEVNDRMVTLISDLLDVSRIEEGRFGFEFSLVSFADIVRNLEDNARAHAADHHVTVAFHTSGDLPASYADQAKLELALGNLIDNAVKYTGAGGRVDVNVLAQGGSIHVSVSDNGIGIPEEDQERIFTKFYRSRNAKLLMTDGSGLGLYITKNIIEEHRGTVRFTSEEGKGTTFFVELPVITNPPKRRVVTFDEEHLEG